MKVSLKSEQPMNMHIQSRLALITKSRDVPTLTRPLPVNYLIHTRNQKAYNEIDSMSQITTQNNTPQTWSFMQRTP